MRNAKHYYYPHQSDDEGFISSLGTSLGTSREGNESGIRRPDGEGAPLALKSNASKTGQDRPLGTASGTDFSKVAKIIKDIWWGLKSAPAVRPGGGRRAVLGHGERWHPKQPGGPAGIWRGGEVCCTKADPEEKEQQRRGLHPAANRPRHTASRAFALRCQTSKFK